MRIALITHPGFVTSQSMPRFAAQLRGACLQRGHEVSVHTASPVLSRWLTHPRLVKWARYIDQYLLFPLRFRKDIAHLPADTLFVFCDQALGPWCPLVSHRPHVVHAHDLLALRSAMGLIAENPTGWSGRVYQRYILRGFQHARRFIAISSRTQADLVQFAGIPSEQITVVHNDLNDHFEPMPSARASRLLEEARLPAQAQGYLLHVGGNQWYKNVAGIFALYAAYVRRCVASGQPPLPLLMVSKPPTQPAALAALDEVPQAGQVIFRQGLSAQSLQAAYSLSAAFLFPSLAEGFGWPIVEAQACGTLVLTTDDAPMNEVAGPAPFLVPRLASPDALAAWSAVASERLHSLLALSPPEREARVQQGLAWAARFQRQAAIDAYLAVYASVLNEAS